MLEPTPPVVYEQPILRDPQGRSGPAADVFLRRRVFHVKSGTVTASQKAEHPNTVLLRPESIIAGNLQPSFGLKYYDSDKSMHKIGMTC